MSEILDINEIKKVLPHRYPFLLIDRVVDIQINDSLTAIKNVTVNEPFFPGHFPHLPVMPGVLILEAMAQASAILAAKGLGAEADDTTVYLFAGADKVKFKRQVVPGDQLRIEVKQARQKGRIWKMDAVSYVDDQVAASANITFTYQNL